MLHSDQRPKVTVEDLLRLKRAERPVPEFWTNFERELRQKQLTALLEKRPWWQELPHFFARRAYLPVGATAILAFTLVSVRYYTPAQLTQVDVAPLAGSAVAVNHPVAAPAAHSFAPVSSPLVNRDDTAALRLDDRAAPVAANTASTLRAEAVELVSAMIAPKSVETPSSRSIAANLASFEQTEPEMVNAVMGNRLSAPAVRVQAAALSRDELASVPTNAAKRSRILAQYTDHPLTPEPTAPEIVRERLARRLGDSEITDRISRIGLKGDQVSLGLTLRL
jgi:hypothetical protein